MAEHVDFLTNRKHIIPICPAAEFLALYATAGDITLYSYVCLNTGMIDTKMIVHVLFVKLHGVRRKGMKFYLLIMKSL